MKWLDNVSFSQKLPAAIIAIGVSIASVVGFVSYEDAKASLIEVSKSNLEANLKVKQTNFTTWLESIRDDLVIQGQNPAAIVATEQFGQAWYEIGSDPTAYLQRYYIDENPHPTGSKEELDRADDGSEYSEVHAEFHPYFRELQRRNGYYDIFLFNREGDLVYSVFKESDYATNLVSGVWADSDLGAAFRASKENAGSQTPSFFDFRPYGPSGDAPARFISVPLNTREGAFVGVLAYQLPVEQLNAIMGDTGGLGETGQAFVVSADGQFLSDLPLTPENDTLMMAELAPDSQALQNGSSSTTIGVGLKGQKVIQVKSAMEFMGKRWLFVVEQDYSELTAPAYALRNSLMAQILFGAVLIGILGFFLARLFTRPLTGVKQAIIETSQGDLTKDVLGANRRDEIGEIAGSIQNLKSVLREAKTMEQGQQRIVELLNTALEDLSSGDLTCRLEDDVPEQYRALASNFNEAIAALENSFMHVSENASRLKSSSASISRSADDLSRRTEGQAATLEETAAAVEELASSVSSTAHSAREADELAQSTRDSAKDGRKDMSEVVDAIRNIEAATKKITVVVGLIEDIAFQTNLLALNAGVEAARAGDAGRGFSVVATEVRGLAQRCAESVSEISKLVDGSNSEVQAGVGRVTKAAASMDEILASINEISSAATNISTATQEQSSALGEINAAVSQLDEVTQKNACMVSETKADSDALASESAALEEQVNRFRIRETGHSLNARSATNAPSEQNEVLRQQARIAEHAAPSLRVLANVEPDWEEF